MDCISQKAVILGAGLLGGSLGMAMRERGLAETIHVWSPRESTRTACAEKAWCDGVFETPEEACRGADLVFLCGPVDKIPPLMETISSTCGEGCIISDVGSTKAGICKAGSRWFPANHPATFIGSHPMAGSEKSGLAYADANLFQGKSCILTPVDSSTEDLARLKKFWDALGMKLFECPPEEHDRIVAHVSHLPHALAAALCNGLATMPAEWKQCAGAGLRDTSRIAAGDPHLWAAIFRENETAFRESIRLLESSLASMKASLDAPDDHALLTFLETARAYRLQLDDESSCGNSSLSS